MNDNEIRELKRALSVIAPISDVAWADPHGTFHKVTAVRCNEEEGCEIAIFDDGTYANLCNAELSDFALITRLA